MIMVNVVALQSSLVFGQGHLGQASYRLEFNY